MSDTCNIMSIYQRMHLETTDWQMQVEPLDAAIDQQHLFNKMQMLHQQMLRSKKLLIEYKKDYAAALHGMRHGERVEHYWQAVEEEQHEFQSIAKELIAFMRTHAFVDAASTHWNQLNDDAKRMMNAMGDAATYYQQHLEPYMNDDEA